MGFQDARLPASIGDQVRARSKESYASVLASINCLDVLSLAESSLRVPREDTDGGAREDLTGRFQQLQALVRRADAERNKWHRAVIDANDGVHKILESALMK
jgi:hypothetical protein